jgi:hypothetical protein
MRIDEIRIADLDKMGLNELTALYYWVGEPTENNWKSVTLGRLWDVREKLLWRVPENEWPEQLVGPEWVIAVRKEMGLSPMTPDELTHYLDCSVLVEMFTKREQLKVKETPEFKWPPELQGEDWEERIWIKYGFEAKKLFPPPTLPHSKVEGIVSTGGQPMTFGEPRFKPKPQRVNDITRTDSFGQLLGEGDGSKGLGNRRRK